MQLFCILYHNLSKDTDLFSLKVNTPLLFRSPTLPLRTKIKRMHFELCGHTFSIDELIDASRKDLIAERLIELVRKNDASYILYDPMPEDIINPNDNWACHAGEDHGITFEFAQNVLCYVSFDAKTKITLSPDIKEIISNLGYKKKDTISQVLLSDSIVLGLIHDKHSAISQISFGSRAIFSDDELIPNRYSCISASLYVV